MKDKRMAIIGLFIAVLLACGIIAFYFGSDRKGPVITVDSALVKPYASSQGQDVLKSYAKAIDKSDGDVSNTIMIENIYIMTDMNSAKVVYTARDKKNNITKFNYMIDYIPSQEELDAKNRTTGSEQQTQQVSANALNTDETTKADSNNKSSKSDANNKTTEAEKTSTSKEKTTEKTSEEQTKEGAPFIELSEKEATINAGTSFYISKYVDSIKDDSESMADLAKRILIKGDYDTKKSGDYTLDVYCTDSQKNESNHVEFILHVK